MSISVTSICNPRRITAISKCISHFVFGGVAAVALAELSSLTSHIALFLISNRRRTFILRCWQSASSFCALLRFISVNKLKLSESVAEILKYFKQQWNKYLSILIDLADYTVIIKSLEPPKQKTHFCLFVSNAFLNHFLLSLAFFFFAQCCMTLTVAPKKGLTNLALVLG